jgi:hypothetical protein
VFLDAVSLMSCTGRHGWCYIVIAKFGAQAIQEPRLDSLAPNVDGGELQT